MFPDVDEPHSHLGRPFFFLSIPINRIFGHRTLTHSLLFAFAAGLFLWFFLPQSIVLGTVAGLLAHVAGDVVTGKVKVLYPLPFSIGIAVPRMGYLLIDRVTRYGLGIVILLFIGRMALKNLNII